MYIFFSSHMFNKGRYLLRVRFEQEVNPGVK